MSLCILIPMKNPEYSKQRLAAVLAPKEREALALNLFNNTLRFLKRHFPQVPVIVVTPSQTIANIAQRFAAKVVLEPNAAGLNCAVSRGTKMSISWGYSAQLLIPADIVELDVTEFKQLINSPRAACSVTVCPSRDGGTNALLSSPPDVIEFQFGKCSSALHLNSAKERQVQWRELKLEKIALDLDTAEDLVQLDSAFVSLLKQPSMTHLSNEYLRGAI